MRSNFIITQPKYNFSFVSWVHTTDFVYLHIHFNLILLGPCWELTVRLLLQLCSTISPIAFTTPPSLHHICQFIQTSLFSSPYNITSLTNTILYVCVIINTLQVQELRFAHANATEPFEKPIMNKLNDLGMVAIYCVHSKSSLRR